MKNFIEIKEIKDIEGVTTQHPYRKLLVNKA